MQPFPNQACRTGDGLITVTDSDLTGNGDPSFDLDNVDVEVVNSAIED